jgi:hypothetical protein
MRFQSVLRTNSCGDKLATRFRVVYSGWGHAMEIHLREVMIDVRTPPFWGQSNDREEMVFTWLDGGEYKITGPNPPVGAVHIISPERSVWSGLPVQDPRMQKKLERPVVFLWQKEDQILTTEVARVCCRMFPATLALTLRDPDGRRLATWFNLRRSGVLRDDLSEDMEPIVLAMVLSSLYDFGPNTSD